MHFSEQFDNPTYCISVVTNAVGSDWEQISYSRFNIALLMSLVVDQAAVDIYLDIVQACINESNFTKKNPNSLS